MTEGEKQSAKPEGKVPEHTGGEPSDMYSLLRDEAKVSTELRKHSIGEITDGDAVAARNEKSFPSETDSRPPTRRTGGSIWPAFVIVVLVAALWIAFEFNEQLIEQFPEAGPWLQAYKEFVLESAQATAEYVEQFRTGGDG